MKIIALLVVSISLSGMTYGQYLYIPSGTSVSPTSTNQNVGIGSGNNNPQFKLHVKGNFGAEGDGASQYPDINLKNGPQRWHLSGPRYGDASNNRLGIFWNDGTSFYDYMTLATNGNVGIGNNNPTSKLEVHTVSDNTLFFARQDKNNGGSSDVFYLRDDRGYAGVNAGTTLKVESWRGAGQQGGTLVNFQTIDNGFNKSRFCINNDNGNVGLGITSPLNALHVYGAEPSGELNLLVQNSNGARTYLTAFASKSSIQTDKDFTIMTKDGGPWVDKLIVTNAGNVGIGTMSPGSFKLAVEGKIGAREINVTSVTTWPDYVFEKSYDLPTLEELSAYLKENKHLPEIPSAATVEKGGVNLGEMNLLLLKKVEELTLYILELKKENDKQQAEIEQLKQAK